MRLLSMFVQGLAAGVALAATVPAFAQDEDITVTGRYGRVPDSVRSLSQAVSYADLDLGTKAGRDELNHRVNLTARYLCDKLGESDASSPVVPSCRDDAVRNAMQRVGTVEEHFAPRGTTWVARSHWAAPYPADWATRYYPAPAEPVPSAPPPAAYPPPEAAPAPAYPAPSAPPPPEYRPHQPRG